MSFKNICLVALFSLLQITTATAQKYSSISSGAIWEDNNGTHINAHGGGVIFHDGKYYWFGEHKGGGDSNNAFVGITCYSSPDLYNWTNEGVALPVVENDETSDITKGSIMERPKVIYNAKTKKFVMMFHLELKGQGYAAARVAVATSDNVTGPYKYLYSYRPNAGYWPIDMTTSQRIDRPGEDTLQWWTKDWREAIERGLFVKQNVEGGQMSRDMTLYVDDDGKAYHIYSSEENLTLHIAELNDDYTQHTGRYIRLAPGGHNEAPALFKKDGAYFMITSGCTGWDPNAARLFKSYSIWGPWKEYPNPCVGKDANLTFHSQSTYILPVQGKKDAFIFMADRWAPKTPSDGRYVWLPIQFSEDGLPFLKWMDSWDLSVFK